MSQKKIFMLIYDRDDGSSEAWSLFYTNMEFFETAELREARIAYLRTRDPELEFDERDMEFTEDPNEFYAKYADEDEDEDGFDPPPVNSGADVLGFLGLIDDAAASKATDIHVTVRADGE